MPYSQGQQIQNQNSSSTIVDNNNNNNKLNPAGNFNKNNIRKFEESNKKHILSDSDSLSSSEDSGNK
jgi:hypothetical protein